MPLHPSQKKPTGLPSSLKRIGRECIGLSLLVLNRFFGREKSGILSVYFHDPSEKLFGSVVRWLIKCGYVFISVKELESILDRNENPVGKKAVITFDDGWKDNLKLLPTIEKYQIPVCFFIPVEPVLSGNFWWEFVKIPKQRELTGLESINDFKRLGGKELEEKIELLRSRFVMPQRNCMTLDDIRRLSKNKLVTIGSHTVSHPILSNLDVESQQSELRDSKSVLSKWLVCDVKYLAYPNGDFNGDTVNIVRDLDYKLCFTVVPKRILPGNSCRYMLPRTEVYDYSGILENKAKVLGLWQPIFSKKVTRKP